MIAMNKREKEYLLYYLEQLSTKLKNNISEMQQGLSHIADITKNISLEMPALSRQVHYDPLSTSKLAEKPPESLIRIKEVCLLVGVSKATIHRMTKEGHFPEPLDLGPRFKAWQKKTILDWINAHNSAK
jgi:prophage regulatory protein